MLRMRMWGAVFGLGALFGLFFPAAPRAAGVADVYAYKLDVADPSGAPLSLYAEERGRGSPVVLLHGLGGSTYSWRFIAPILARNHRVIAIDLKGFGRSDKVFDRNYSAADQAQLIAAFLARRGLHDITLIGHSFGGAVALLTAIQLKRHDPSRIRQLVLIDAPVLPQMLSPIVAFMQQPVLPYVLLTAIPPSIATYLALAPSAARRLARHYTDADADAYAQPYYDAAARHAYIQTARQIAPNLGGLLKTYRGVQQRTLLVWCTNDEIVPLATGRALVTMLPNARLEQLDGCNHAPTDEAPAALASSLVRFLNH